MANPIERLRLELKHADGSVLALIDAIAAETGIKPKTLRNLHYGATRTLHYENVLKLERRYARIDARRGRRAGKDSEARVP